VGFKLRMLVVIGTDCIDSTITSTTTPVNLGTDVNRIHISNFKII
jgi:hypothetical protein